MMHTFLVAVISASSVDDTEHWVHLENVCQDRSMGKPREMVYTDVLYVEFEYKLKYQLCIWEPAFS